MGNMPKIRFPGFTDEWEQRKLDEVANYRNGKAHENDIDDDGDYIVVNSKFVSTDGEQFRLILEMGMRTSELIGLEWKCVDLEKRELRIEKTLEFRYSTQKWSWGPPKTKQGFRTLKMTNKAYEILKEMWDNRRENPKTPEEFKDLVFINRTGYPTKNSTYDAALVKRCEQAGVKRVSMHDLRHTMATRFCECSTDYKRLSKILGHSSIKITVDTYVHETEQTIEEATAKFSNYLDSMFD